MKKIISVLLAVLMLVSCASYAFAATIDQNSADKNADVVVQTTLTGSDMPATGTYEISIPANVNIIWGTTTPTPENVSETGSLNYSVTSQLALGAKLKVSVSADAADVDSEGNKLLVCTDDSTQSLVYTATGFSTQTFDNAINNAKTPDEAVTITVSDWSKAPVATYDTTLTYTVEYVPAA